MVKMLRQRLCIWWDEEVIMENILNGKPKREIKKGEIRKHIISILVNNEFGVLARISTLIAGKGYNIESLSVGDTSEANLSRITIEVKGDDVVIDQMIKQLRRLIDTVKVRDLTDTPRVERELMLIKLHAPTHRERDDILRISQIFRGKVVDMAQDSMIIELTGDSEKIKAFLNLVKPFGIKELATTGKITLRRDSVLEEEQS